MNHLRNVLDRTGETNQLQPEVKRPAKTALRSLALLMVLLVLSAVIFGACSAGSSQTAPSTTTPATTAAGRYDNEKAGFSDGQGNQAPGYETGQPTNPMAMAVKIIRNASLDIEADDVLKAYDALLRHAAANGGYEASRKVTTHDEYTSLEARIKIKPEFLDDLLGFAGTTGKIINVQTSSQDITENYYDTQTRLATMESMLGKYQEFLTNAKTVQEALSVQSEINRLTTEIESLKGKLRYYDTMVAESTVTVRIQQTNDPVKIKKEITWTSLTWEDMSYLMQRGLMGVINTLTGVFQWLSIVLVAASPLIVIAVIILIIVIRRRRKTKAKARAQAIAPDAKDTNNTPQA